MTESIDKQVEDLLAVEWPDFQIAVLSRLNADINQLILRKGAMAAVSCDRAMGIEAKDMADLLLRMAKDLQIIAYVAKSRDHGMRMEKAMRMYKKSDNPQEEN